MKTRTIFSLLIVATLILSAFTNEATSKPDDKAKQTIESADLSIVSELQGCTTWPTPLPGGCIYVCTTDCICREICPPKQLTDDRNEYDSLINVINGRTLDVYYPIPEGPDKR